MTDEQVEAVAKRIKDEFPGVMKQWVAVRLARAAIEAYEAQLLKDGFMIVKAEISYDG